jgi:hypothetical protein
MRHCKLLFGSLLLLLVLFAANTVLADSLGSYTLNVDYCSSGCLFGGTGGTVDLTQVGTTPGEVQLTVSLTGVDFHGTGLQSFVFNLTGISGAVSIQGQNSGFSQITGPIHEDGAGIFGYGLNCSSCGPQQNGIKTAALTFDVFASGLTVSDFHSLSSGGSPSAYFAAAVFNTSNTTCTGEIGSNFTGTPTIGGSNTGTGTCGSTAVPEPTSLALLGCSGLIGLCPFVRRRLLA